MKALRFNKKTLTKVVIFTLISLVFTVGLAIKIGNLRLFQHTNSYSAVFHNAAGVFKGDAVKLAGVDVGRVTGTDILNGHAVVNFTVDDSVQLTSSTVAAIRWRNVLGLRFLYLYPGDRTGRMLEDGDVIGLDRTQDAGDIGEFLNSLGPILQAIDPDKANAFLDAVNTALSGNEVAVRSLIDDAASLTSDLGTQDQRIKSLVSSSGKIMSAYASQSDNIATILDDLDILGAKLRGMTSDVNSVLENFSVVQQQLNRLLTENRGNIDATVRDLRSVTGLLSANRGELANTLCTLPTGVAPYFQTTSWGEWFNVRVVEIVFKDQDSNVVSRAGEFPNSRGPKSNPVVTCGAVRSKGPVYPNPFSGQQGLQGPGLSPLLDFAMGGNGA
jgi:phospholipid/cholesterol/gamma-HCH transport system substrate-binding protein